MTTLRNWIESVENEAKDKTVDDEDRDYIMENQNHFQNKRLLLIFCIDEYEENVTGNKKNILLKRI